MMRAGCWVGLAAAWLALAPAASAQSVSPVALRHDAAAGRTALLVSYYHAGVMRLGSGDPAAARTVFATASSAAPDLPQLRAALAIAILLADFADRAEALPQIRAALGANPDAPLYRVIEVLADPSQSALGEDGALRLSARGTRTLDEAAPRLAGEREAYNAKYLAMLLATRAPTGDAAMPQRIAGFGAMLGPGKGVALPGIGERVSLGRLFEIAVPSAAFRPFEPEFVERLLQGRVSGAGRETVAQAQ